VFRAVDGVPDPNPILTHDGWVLAVTLSGDGRIVVSGGKDRDIRLFRDHPRAETTLLTNAAIRALALARDIPFLVAVLENGQVLHIWIENVHE
jgi:hypothetical protein